MNTNDPYDLNRFITAQEKVYATALAELKNGQKRSHWMWFIFPQIAGLGFSSTTRYYAIKSIAEAQEYLGHPILGTRLRECAEVLLTLEDHSVSAIFGYPDDLKLKSSLTLFAHATNAPNSVFLQVLDKYFHGEQDTKTLNLLEKTKSEKGASH